MKEFLDSHLYLMSQVIIVALYLFGLLILYEYRKSIFIASILAAPQAFYAFLLVPIYWNPPRIMIFGVGIEDFIFSFLAGGLVWMGVLLFFKNKLIFQYRIKTIILRFLMVFCLSILVISILYLVGFKDMLNPFITMIIACVVILIYSFSYWKIFLFESIASLLVYGVGLKTVFFIWPDLITLWTRENLWGLSIAGIPLEELVWAFLYGGSWCLTIAFILNVKPKKI